MAGVGVGAVSVVVHNVHHRYDAVGREVIVSGEVKVDFRLHEGVLQRHRVDAHALEVGITLRRGSRAGIDGGVKVIDARTLNS